MTFYLIKKKRKKKTFKLSGRIKNNTQVQYQVYILPVNFSLSYVTDYPHRQKEPSGHDNPKYT